MALARLPRLSGVRQVGGRCVRGVGGLGVALVSWPGVGGSAARPDDDGNVGGAFDHAHDVDAANDGDFGGADYDDGVAGDVDAADDDFGGDDYNNDGISYAGSCPVCNPGC